MFKINIKHINQKHYTVILFSPSYFKHMFEFILHDFWGLNDTNNVQKSK